jgi:hypothetical protein
MVSVHCYCQNSLFIENKGFIGYIFSKEHFVFLSIEKEKERYTPTKDDIYLAECILIENKSFLKKNQDIQAYCPMISENLENYIRQYVGFINKNDEKILWINFIWKGYAEDLVEKDIVYPYDGGSLFWSIFINLNTKVLFNMKVNGVS